MGCDAREPRAATMGSLPLVIIVHAIHTYIDEHRSFRSVEPILTNACQYNRERRDMPHSSGRQTGERIPTFCVDSEQHERQTSRRESD